VTVKPRSTGSWTDRLRTAWAELARRRGLQGLDRRAHRVYAHWERLRHGASLMADRRSLRAYLSLERAGASGGPRRVRVRPLGGASFELRPGTTDAVSLRDTFRDCVHPPPAEAAQRGVRQIVDLGTNIGATVAHNAVLYPEARILGVELDPDTAALARRNIAPWADRCEILQGAVWTEDGTVHYDGEREDGYQVSGASTGGRSTRALSMETVFGHLPDGARVDYLKMDIEGVEARLLSGSAAAWIDRVDAISLQVHDPYTTGDCERDLAALGFVTRVDHRRPDYVVGVRPSTAPGMDSVS
jgi:FkbM family methyltransferase